MPNLETRIVREKIDAIIGNCDSSRGRAQCGKLLESYVDYLEQWLTTHNVASRKNTLLDLWENVYDSLVLYEDRKSAVFESFSRQTDIVDAGAGGGFPGIPLAIVFAEKNFRLVDINRKKCSFLRFMKAKLNLNNVSVVESEIEAILAAKFIITKAAFSPPRASVLADSLVTDGQILMWASTNSRRDFQDALEKRGMHLEEEYNYNLAHHAPRSLLLFRKTR